MKNYYNIHTVWIVMVLLTLSTYAVGELGFSGVGTMMFVLLAAVIKSCFIIRDFMELKGVSRIWQIIMYGWLGTVCSAISVAYFISL